MADQIVNDFTIAIRDLETPRDQEVAVRVGNDRKIVITGFSALMVSMRRHTHSHYSSQKNFFRVTV